MVDFKVCIVEHNDAIRDNMVRALKDSFKTEAVKTGTQALQIMSTFQPDLVLIDFQIEDMSSVQLQQQITQEYPHIHTAMISNVDRSKVYLESMKRRAMDYIYRTEDAERFLSDVCKLARYIIDMKFREPQETAFKASGFYDLAKKLYENKKWTVDEIQKMVEERSGK